MKICFLGDGGSIHILRWLDYFSSKGHEVHLITFTPFRDTSNLAERNNVFIHELGRHSINSEGGNWYYLFNFFKTTKLIKKIKPDIVNAHYITSYGFIGSLLGVNNLVLSAWGSDILVTPNKNFIYKFITKFALKKAKLITSDSNYMAKAIKELGNSKVLTVPMGVEEKLLTLKREANSEEITILSLRSIDDNSNIDCIIMAFKLFLDRYPNSKLIIANDGPELDNMKKLVERLSITDKVEFKGFVSRKDLIKLLLKSSLYVSIPKSDSTSVTLLEAMACGIIPIVSNHPANREWITNGDNGLTIDYIDANLLSIALIKAVNSNQIRSKCIIENRKIIRTKAIWHDNMMKVENEYLKLINP